MAYNDCWWWFNAAIDGAYQKSPRNRSRDMGIGAAAVLALIAFGALLHQGYKGHKRWLAQQAVIEAKSSETKMLLAAIADHKIPPQEDKIHDAWGVELRIKEEKGTLWDKMKVTSAGPDLTFDTFDDISESRSSLVQLDRVGEKVGKSVGDFGIGTVKGLYRSAKDHLVGDEKETAHAKPDAGPNEGANP